MILALFQFSLAPFVRHNIQSWEQDYSLGPCSLRAFTFNLRGRSFIFRSRRNASGFSIGPLMHTSLTGRRQHVYRLALPDLFASSLRLMSLVTPQYRVLSAQRRRYVNHGFSPCWLNFRPHAALYPPCYYSADQVFKKFRHFSTIRTKTICIQTKGKHRYAYSGK